MLNSYRSDYFVRKKKKKKKRSKAVCECDAEVKLSTTLTYDRLLIKCSPNRRSLQSS